MSNLIKTLHMQGKLIIMPMVEDPRILPALWQCGVNYIQGYYLQAPRETLDYDFAGHCEEIG